MAAKTRELTAYGARKKKFLRRDFGDLEVQVGVRDVTSPIAVLGITDFGNNWEERARDRISVLPPQRGGAVPSPMGMGRNGRTDLPRGSTERSPPLSRIPKLAAQVAIVFCKPLCIPVLF